MQKIEIDASEIRTIDRLRDNYSMIESMKQYQIQMDKIFYETFWASYCYEMPRNNIRKPNSPDKEQIDAPETANSVVRQ